MKLEEIWVNPPRDEYLDDRSHRFANATGVATIKGLTLKRSSHDEDIFYGLFNDTALVGYVSLRKYSDGMYQVGLSQIAPSYRGQGLGTFMYDYAILNDKMTVISDTVQTPDAKKLWMRFRTNGHFIVKPFDLSTNKTVEATDEQVYSSDNLVWIAYPTGKTINESLRELNSRYAGERYVVWYGASGEDYFNY